MLVALFSTGMTTRSSLYKSLNEYWNTWWRAGPNVSYMGSPDAGRSSFRSVEKLSAKQAVT
jgi:hypothetical protein